VLTAPDDLSDDALRHVLQTKWGMTVRSIDFRAVGFGSHHWDVVDAEGVRHFVTVDDLDTKKQSREDSREAAFGRLRTALTGAGDVRRAGAPFVVAPTAAGGGQPVVGAAGRYAVAVYPFVDGHHYRWGDTLTPAHRRGLLDLIVSLHALPVTVLGTRLRDLFDIAHRHELEASLGDDGQP